MLSITNEPNKKILFNLKKIITFLNEIKISIKDKLKYENNDLIKINIMFEENKIIFKNIYDNLK
jgi:hypothetical protein